jgi:hypothetical protein
MLRILGILAPTALLNGLEPAFSLVLEGGLVAGARTVEVAEAPISGVSARGGGTAGLRLWRDDVPASGWGLSLGAALTARRHPWHQPDADHAYRAYALGVAAGPALRLGDDLLLRLPATLDAGLGRSNAAPPGTSADPGFYLAAGLRGEAAWTLWGAWVATGWAGYQVFIGRETWNDAGGERRLTASGGGFTLGLGLGRAF